nr:lytic transglycosylase domain-containing protein [Pelomonas sp. P8]
MTLALACAPAVHIDTAQALVDVESALNPWAIGVVGGTLVRQPSRRAEALATARALQANGWNISVGLAQINARNLRRLGLTLETAFEPCSNLAAMQAVLTECHERAGASAGSEQRVLQRALSCYYSGDFSTGFVHGYVQRVINASASTRRLASPSQVLNLKPKE